MSQKTSKATAKRFKVTGSGKVIRRSARIGHNTRKESMSTKQAKKRPRNVKPAERRIIKEMLRR